MSNTTRPGYYANWVPSGSALYIVQPPSGQLTTGWVANEKPPFRYFNWLLYTFDQWIQYLDYTTVASQVTVTSTTAIAAPNRTYLADVSGGAFTLTLPAISAVPVGKRFTIKNITYGSATAATLAPNGSDNLEGANTSFALQGGEYITVEASATGWQQVG